jgi:hypothetical protein
MLAIQGSISFHVTNFGPIKSLHHENFMGEELNTSSTVSCL